MKYSGCHMNRTLLCGGANWGWALGISISGHLRADLRREHEEGKDFWVPTSEFYNSFCLQSSSSSLRNEVRQLSFATLKSIWRGRDDTPLLPKSPSLEVAIRALWLDQGTSILLIGTAIRGEKVHTWRILESGNPSSPSRRKWGKSVRIEQT